MSDIQKRAFSRWFNACLVQLQLRDFPAKHRFYQWLSRLFQQRVICHRLHGRSFWVPIDEWCFWLEKGPENYYLDEFLPFFEVVNQFDCDFIFFDLGADIGTVSALASQHCPRLSHIFAFEPNPASYQLLSANLQEFAQPGEAIEKAVSDFNGYASLVADPQRSNDHDGHIVADAKGNIAVCALDQYFPRLNLASTPLVVIKIDVEGQELAVLQGAARVIGEAENIVILLELHPEVLSKTGQSPEALFAAAEQHRHFDWLVPKYNNAAVDRTQPFYKQFADGQYDVIGISKT